MNTIKEKLGLGHKEEKTAAHETGRPVVGTEAERMGHVGPGVATGMAGPGSGTYGPGQTVRTETTAVREPVVESRMPATTHMTEEELRTRVRAPVVHEEVREREETRIKPVVEREVVRPEIEQVIQPIQERVVAPTQVQTAAKETQIRELPAQRSAEDERRYREQAASVRDETTNAGVARSEVRGEAVVEERVRGERYQEIQPVIERVVEKPKVTEVTEHIKEIEHAAPRVHELKVNAPIGITEAEPLLKGHGAPVAQGTYQEYQGAPRAPGEMAMHPAENIARKGEEHELKKEARAGVTGQATRTTGTSGAA